MIHSSRYSSWLAMVYPLYLLSLFVFIQTEPRETGDYSDAATNDINGNQQEAPSTGSQFCHVLSLAGYDLKLPTQHHF